MDPERIQSFLHELSKQTGWYRWMNGDCYKLYLLLKELFPEAEAWYDPIDCHIYTRIGKLWYDISGIRKRLPKGSSPLKDHPHAAAQAPHWCYEYDAVRHA